ncbi:Diadenosine tetraphosphate (Ap4A) hydrolase [Desulfotomaculum arcticum]|uniref:Diadenosine tetraphosphate (Ap4A) hydrolase n=1 Tax=Desulfotruncus arcticus DSM 17038 TaxID=1121424 RepID=A0A1I2YAM3_9FIRM|nr:Diadenosine tetraphosphate (Ap4A) hydrolase [Desulfotomaculum arcticum] [Desulfotruncus arcticus DSM 17038]
MAKPQDKCWIAKKGGNWKPIPLPGTVNKITCHTYCIYGMDGQKTCDFWEGQKNDTCPFCSPEETGSIIATSERVFAIYDNYPVSEGHALIIPRRHVEDYFELKFGEKKDVWAMVEVVKSLLNYIYRPDGYNIGINVLRDAGQTVPHCHVHLIPRYKGDVENPRGGVRGVIPGKKVYTVKDADGNKYIKWLEIEGDKVAREYKKVISNAD